MRRLDSILRVPWFGGLGSKTMARAGVLRAHATGELDGDAGRGWN